MTNDSFNPFVDEEDEIIDLSLPSLEELKSDLKIDNLNSEFNFNDFSENELDLSLTDATNDPELTEETLLDFEFLDENASKPSNEGKRAIEPLPPIDDTPTKLFESRGSPIEPDFVDIGDAELATTPADDYNISAEESIVDENNWFDTDFDAPIQEQPTFEPFTNEEVDLEENDLVAQLSLLSDDEHDTLKVDSNDSGEQVNSALPKWKQKLNKTISEIKSDLNGDETEDEDNSTTEEKEDKKKKPNKDNKQKGLLSKILSPYFWLTDLILSIILAVLGIFTYIPLIGPLLKPLLTPNIFFKIIARLLPIVLIFLFLYWQGAKPLLPAKQLSFPDGGHAIIKDFGYDNKSSEAFAVVKNDGQVIAEVKPTIFIYSIQPSLNPLSFFIPKANAKCIGKPVAVQIGKEKKVRVKCEVKGTPKKVTGELKW